MIGYAKALPRPSPNFWEGYDQRDFIVVHATASGDGATEYVPDFSGATPKSTHYAIALDGVVVQYVSEENSAWGNCCTDGNSSFAAIGDYNWNKSTISIENEKHSDDNSVPVTVAQYASLLVLVRDIAARWKIPLVHGSLGVRGIIYHHDLMPIAKALCPGTFPYTTFFSDLQKGGPSVAKRWFDYPIIVPFGDTNYDVGVGGSHDLTVGAPPNYPVTALLPGKVVDVSAPSWGEQVGIQLDSPYNGIPFMSYLHLSATNVSSGQHVNKGDVIGWVGGANTQSQYAGTSNPTGHNFLNTPFMSSQVQVGVALIRGPIYGTGAGWAWSQGEAPDMSLNPTQIILNARAEGATMPLPTGAKDDGTAIHFANSPLVIVKGFRRLYNQLAAANQIPPDDMPLTNEYGANPVELSNPEYWGGPGMAQETRYFRLGYSPKVDVKVTYIGQEFRKIADTLTTTQRENVELKAKVAALQVIIDAGSFQGIPQVIKDDIISLASHISPTVTLFTQLVHDAGLDKPPSGGGE